MREAVVELGFDLRGLCDGGALDVWIEVALDTPFEQLLPGIRIIRDTADATSDCEFEFDLSEDRVDGVIVELIAWLPQ